MKKLLLALICLTFYVNTQEPKVTASEIPDNASDYDSFIKAKYAQLGYHKRIAQLCKSECQKQHKRKEISEMIRIVNQNYKPSIFDIYRVEEFFGYFTKEMIAEHANGICLYIDQTLTKLEQISCENIIEKMEESKSN